MKNPTINYSRWFFVEHDKPERVGVYEVSAMGRRERDHYGLDIPKFAYWNGERFTQVCDRPEYAAVALDGSVFGLFFWRGLSDDPGTDAIAWWLRTNFR